MRRHFACPVSGSDSVRSSSLICARFCYVTCFVMHCLEVNVMEVQQLIENIGDLVENV